MRWLLPIVLVACGGSSGSPGGNTGGTTQTLVVQASAGQSLSIPAPGGTVQLGAYQYQGSNDGYGGGGGLVAVTATWSSSTPAVATVDKNGLVAAVANGSTVITAANDGGTGSATVVVGPSMMTGAPGAVR